MCFDLSLSPSGKNSLSKWKVLVMPTINFDSRCHYVVDILGGYGIV